MILPGHAHVVSMPSIKERLREGPPLSGYLNLIPSPVATQALAAAGADVVVIDQEHGPIGAESVHAMVAATAGTGCGAQISFQIAYRGFEVTTYDVSDAALKQARQRFKGIASVYPTEVEGATAAAAQETIERIRLTTQLASAVQGADLVIEAVPESLELKRDVFARIAALAAPAAVFVTNSSTLVPSELMDSTGRPDRFLALHFANHIWVNNMAEVMSSPNTDPRVYQRVLALAKEIGMVPIELHKEQRGYIVNSLLGPFLMAAADLLLRGVAEPNTIDTTWRIATGAPRGPFEIFDIIGLRTAYAVASAGGPDRQAWADYLKGNYIDQGKLGVESGEGFYSYPMS